GEGGGGREEAKLKEYGVEADEEDEGDEEAEGKEEEAMKGEKIKTEDEKEIAGMLREEVNGGRDNKGQEARGGGGGGRASEGGGDLSFPRSVKPIAVSLPSTSPAHNSVVATSTPTGIDFCTTLPLHMVGKFVSFLSISGCSPVSLVVEVLLLSTASSSRLLDRCPFFLPYRCTPCNFLQQSSIAATISATPFSVGNVICYPCYLIPLPHLNDVAALIYPYSPGNHSRCSPLPLPTALLPASSLLLIL
ncbi:hypothetical protein B296_00051104, partial [Ensete ventricosum]